MAIWNIEFFPRQGEPDSPIDALVAISDAGASIVHRLEVLRDLDIGDWPRHWTKQLWGDVWQLTGGDVRAMYCLDQQSIIVLHICRKKGQKTHPRDRERAQIHYAEYIAQKKRLLK